MEKSDGGRKNSAWRTQRTESVRNPHGDGAGGAERERNFVSASKSRLIKSTARRMPEIGEKTARMAQLAPQPRGCSRSPACPAAAERSVLRLRHEGLWRVIGPQLPSAAFYDCVVRAAAAAAEVLRLSRLASRLASRIAPPRGLEGGGADRRPPRARGRVAERSRGRKGAWAREGERAQLAPRCRAQRFTNTS